MKERKTLYLSLKKEWYNLIDDGVKAEEYREIKPYWVIKNVPFEKFTIPILKASTGKWERGFSRTTLMENHYQKKSYFLILKLQSI